MHDLCQTFSLAWWNKKLYLVLLKDTPPQTPLAPYKPTSRTSVKGNGIPSTNCWITQSFNRKFNLLANKVTLLAQGVTFLLHFETSHKEKDGKERQILSEKRCKTFFTQKKRTSKKQARKKWTKEMLSDSQQKLPRDLAEI